MNPERRIFPFLSLALAVLLLLSAGLHPVIAESDSEPFVFRNGITWTSSAEEVMAAEGTPGRKPAVEEGPLTMYLGSGYTAAGYPGQLSYLFMNSRLSVISCGLTGYKDGDAALNEILAELTGMYGEPNCSDFERIISLAEAIGGQLDAGLLDGVVKYAWILPDSQTLIMLANIEGAGGLGLMYLNENTLSGNPSAEEEAEAEETGSLWETVCGKDERCLAADAEGNHFLLYNNTQYPETVLSVLDKGSGMKRELWFSALEDAEFRAEWLLKNLRIPEKTKDAVRTKYETPETLVMRLGMGSGLRAEGSGGDYFLFSSSSLGYARADVRTGETVPVQGTRAFITRDGTILFYSNRDRKLLILRPDQTVPEVFPVSLPFGVQVQALCLLSDGSVWLTESEMLSQQPEVNGRKILAFDVSFVQYGADGAELRRVKAGTLGSSALPDFLRVSEETGTVLSFGKPAYNFAVWCFGEGDDTAKDLLPESLSPPALRKAEREEVTDEAGFLLPAARMLHPMGQSADQKSLLVLDVETGTLLTLDLASLKAEIRLSVDELMNAFAEKPIELPGPMLLLNMYWNGTDLLCPMFTEGCVLRLPAAADGK